MKKLLLTSIILFSVSVSAFAQVKLSVATDASLLRNFSPKQKFWAFGQTVQLNLHFTPAESAYAWINYYSPGRYRNNFTSLAKGPIISPQTISYTADGRLLFRQLSLGWKHYFKGSYNERNKINIYGTAGFGLFFARVQNSFSIPVDSFTYFLQTKEGLGTVKKLTADLGLGAEVPIGGNFYAYGGFRTWLPASSNRSPYVYDQRNLPLPLIIHAGIRILFDFSNY